MTVLINHTVGKIKIKSAKTLNSQVKYMTVDENNVVSIMKIK